MSPGKKKTIILLIKRKRKGFRGSDNGGSKLPNGKDRGLTIGPKSEGSQPVKSQALFWGFALGEGGRGLVNTEGEDVGVR